MRRQGCLCRTTLCRLGQSRDRIHTACSWVLVDQFSSRRLETVLAASSPRFDLTAPSVCITDPDIPIVIAAKSEYVKLKRIAPPQNPSNPRLRPVLIEITCRPFDPARISLPASQFPASSSWAIWARPLHTSALSNRRRSAAAPSRAQQASVPNSCSWLALPFSRM
jgi:hypothetical protein